MTTAGCVHHRSPAQSQVLRSTNPVFQVVSSQVVSSVGSGHHTSQPCSRDGVISPRYNTPPAYAPRPVVNVRQTSVPEMNPDHLPHRLRNDRYSSPSPSPSQQVCQWSLCGLCVVCVCSVYGLCVVRMGRIFNSYSKFQIFEHFPVIKFVIRKFTAINEYCSNIFLRVLRRKINPGRSLTF